MTDGWLVVGGGLHGVHLALRLVAQVGVPASSVRILDPGPCLLHRWRVRTATVGMSHLRSPSVHHLGLDPWDLQRFAGSKRHRRPGLFAPPYDRPALGLFDAHCDHLIATHDLGACHVRGAAVAGEVGDDGVEVTLEDGRALSAAHVVLAVGGGTPAWPTWAPRDSARVQHVFRPGFDGWPADGAERVLVVGGGISAGQVALRLVEEGHTVHVAVRHELRKAQFDSDPGWLGPKYLARFDRETDLAARRRMIQEARNRGSLPPRLFRAIKGAESRGELQRHPDEIHTVEEAGDHLCVRGEGGFALKVDRILLATGLSAERPGGTLVDTMIASAELPCADCGYPAVGPSLRWHPRVHVAGPLAELALGPAAGNIAGARKAGDRLVAGLENGRAEARGAA